VGRGNVGIRKELWLGNNELLYRVRVGSIVGVEFRRWVVPAAVSS
jgi:hypothetical protein